MPEATLQEVRLEFYGCTVYGTLNNQNVLECQLCGHDMSSANAHQEASKVIAQLQGQGNKAKNLTACAECADCSLDCFSTPREGSLADQIDELMKAVCQAADVIGQRAELTFAHDSRSFTFSAEWGYLPGSLGMSGNLTFGHPVWMIQQSSYLRPSGAYPA